MNKPQKIILWIGIAIFIWIGFNPRLYRRFEMPPEAHAAQLEIIRTEKDFDQMMQKLRQVREENATYYTDINFGWKSRERYKILIYWPIIVVVTGGLIYTFKTKRT